MQMKTHAHNPQSLAQPRMNQRSVQWGPGIVPNIAQWLEPRAKLGEVRPVSLRAAKQDCQIFPRRFLQDD